MNSVQNLERAQLLMAGVSASVMGVPIQFRVELDGAVPQQFARTYIQVIYKAPNTVSGEEGEWKGRKWFLSEFMTDDEIIKTAYCAVEKAVIHEMMEGFLYETKRVFNPHTPFRALMEACQTQQFRTEQK